MAETELILPPEAQLSIKDASERFHRFLHRDTELMKSITDLKITNDDQFKHAGALLKLVRDTWKEEDIDRKERAAPGEAWSKAINDISRDHLKTLKDFDRQLVEAMTVYAAAKEAERQRVEAELKKQAAEAQQAGTGTVSPDQVSVAATPKTTANVVGNITMRDKWVGILVDESLVDKMYWVIDDDKVQKDIQAGKGTYIPAGYRVEYRPVPATGDKGNYRR